jgi:hypothetical protein
MSDKVFFYALAKVVLFSYNVARKEVHQKGAREVTNGNDKR